MNPLAVRSSKVHAEEHFSAPLSFAAESQFNAPSHYVSATVMNPNHLKGSRIFNSVAALLASHGSAATPSTGSDLCATSDITLQFVHTVMEAEYVVFRMKHRFITFQMPISFLLLMMFMGGGFYFSEVQWYTVTFPDPSHVYTSPRLLYGGAVVSVIVIAIIAGMAMLVKQNPLALGGVSLPSDGGPSGASERSAGSDGDAPLPFLQLALGHSDVHIERRKNARHFELCLCALHSFCVPAFLVILFFSKIDCLAMDTCTSQFAYEALAAPLSLFCCIMLPMRAHLFLFGTAVLVVCRVVMHFLPDVPSMDVQNVLLMHAFVLLAVAGSLVLSASLDRWARDQFATYIRSIVELDELREVQERTRQMVSHQIPPRFVDRIDRAVGGGVVIDPALLGISCVIRLVRFAEWASLRSASDALQLVQTAFGAVDKLCRPFRSAISSSLMRHHSWGDEVVLTSAISNKGDGGAAALIGLVLSVLSKYAIDVRRVKAVPVEPFRAHREAKGQREAPQLCAVLGTGPTSTALVHAGNVNLVAEGPAVRSCRSVLEVLQATTVASNDESGALYVGESLFRELAELLGGNPHDAAVFFLAAKRVVSQVKAALEPGNESPDSTASGNSPTTAEDLFLSSVLRCRTSRTDVVGELLVGVRSLTSLGPLVAADSFSLSSLRSLCQESSSPHNSTDELLVARGTHTQDAAAVAENSVLDAAIVRLLPSSTSTVMMKRVVWFLPLFLSFTDPEAESSYRNEFTRPDPFRQWAFASICLLNSISFFTTCYFYPELPHSFQSMSSFMWLLIAVLCSALMLPTVYFSTRMPTAYFAILDALYYCMCASLLTAIVAAEGTRTPIGVVACTPFLFLFTYLPLLRPQQSNVWRLVVVDVAPLAAYSYVSFVRQYCGWPQLPAIGVAMSTITIVRFFWDGHLRDYYAAQLELLDVKASLTRDYLKLEETLEAFAPTGVAKQLIQNSRKARAKNEIDISGVDFNKSTDLTTGVGDVPFVVFEVQARENVDEERFHEAATAVRRHFLAAAAAHEKLEVVKATASCVVMCSPKEPASCPTDNDEERTLTLAVAFASIVAAIAEDDAARTALRHRAVLSCGQLKGAVIGRDAGASFDLYGGPMATALQLLESLEPNALIATPKFVSFLWPFGSLNCHCGAVEEGVGRDTEPLNNVAAVPLCFEGPSRVSVKGLAHLTHCYTVHLRRSD